MDTAQWISNEFKEIKFGDIRLHRRFLKVASHKSFMAWFFLESIQSFLNQDLLRNR